MNEWINSQSISQLVVVQLKPTKLSEVPSVSRFAQTAKFLGPTRTIHVYAWDENAVVQLPCTRYNPLCACGSKQTVSDIRNELKHPGGLQELHAADEDLITSSVYARRRWQCVPNLSASTRKLHRPCEQSECTQCMALSCLWYWM